jgi:hypothetical protein
MVERELWSSEREKVMVESEWEGEDDFLAQESYGCERAGWREGASELDGGREQP